MFGKGKDDSDQAVAVAEPDASAPTYEAKGPARYINDAINHACPSDPDGDKARGVMKAAAANVADAGDGFGELHVTFTRSDAGVTVTAGYTGYQVGDDTEAPGEHTFNYDGNFRDAA